MYLRTKNQKNRHSKKMKKKVENPTNNLNEDDSQAKKEQ